MKAAYDHTPHEVFVELEELLQTPYGGLEWKETARWIKYEEDVEEVSNRWGKPHIPCLNFNALFSLRKGLERGSILLDLEAEDLHTIAQRVVDHMVATNQIPPEQRDSVIKVLLLKHKHVKETGNPLRRASRAALGLDDEPGTGHNTPGRRRSSAASLRKSLANALKVSSFSSSVDSYHSYTDPKAQERRNTLAQLDIEGDRESKNVINLDLKRKLSNDAEALVCLVGSLDFLTQPTIAFVRLAEGIHMENLIEVPIPIRFVFVLLGPYGAGIDYKEIGRSISTLMADRYFHEAAYKAASRSQILNAINEFLNSSIVFPPSDWKNNELVPIDEIRNRAREMMRRTEEQKSHRLEEEKETTIKGQLEEEEQTPSTPPRDPLQRKGRLFYGMIQDIKERYSQYVSDIKDGFSPQVLSACLFIFFAALSPAITFGGLYAQKTNKYIGVGETLLISCVNGLLFAFFAAQPLLIIGATGPLMIFDLSLLNFCNSMELDYLAIRVWIGIWILIIGILVAAFEAVAIVKKFTRFTEEIYSTLVCVIFIYGAFESLVGIFVKHPLGGGSTSEEPENSTGSIKEEMELEMHMGESEMDPNGTILANETLDAFGNETLDMVGNMTEVENEAEISFLANQPNTALFSMVLMLGTFIIAWKLKKFRNSKFLGRGIRRALGDFGVPISIFVMVLIDYFIDHLIYTDKLGMPKGLKPSNSAIRGWVINPFGVEKPLPVWCMFAAGPAALLLYILIFLEGNICQLILMKPERGLKKGSGFHLDMVLSCLINTIAGIFGAPFMSPAVVRTVAHMSSLTITSTKVAPGESPKIVGCIEQRVSVITVSVLIGLSVMLYAVLNLVSNAVLLGIFLYMGISATAGIQILERIVLYFMPVKHHPNVPYVKNVTTMKMHLFTGIQVLVLVILWIVKQSPASLAVPFILICLIPFRIYVLPLIFTQQELIALDGAPQVEEANEDDERDFYETAHDLGTQIEPYDQLSTVYSTKM